MLIDKLVSIYFSFAEAHSSSPPPYELSVLFGYLTFRSKT